MSGGGVGWEGGAGGLGRLKKKTNLCSVNKVTNWVETCSPNPFPAHATQKSNHVKILIKVRKKNVNFKQILDCGEAEQSGGGGSGRTITGTK